MKVLSAAGPFTPQAFIAIVFSMKLLAVGQRPVAPTFNRMPVAFPVKVFSWIKFPGVGSQNLGTPRG